jgi:2-methylcitrate dehydratase PrpD
MSASSAPPTAEAESALAMRIARAVHACEFDALPPEVPAKARVCLQDFIGCVFESRHLPWSRQARSLAVRCDVGATMLGHTNAVAPGDAAFANAVMGHGLVREDMHPGSISHLGIVVIPALLAVAETRTVTGRDFIAAMVAGYEVGGQVGRALMDRGIAAIHRPTGITGPIAAAAACARAMGLPVEGIANAVALAANTTSGFNQWAHTGGSEMFFHAGFAARNAVTAARLAAAGAFASPSALDGVAGLFAAFGKRDAAHTVRLFDGAPEILSVYHKPVPACNFAQTPAQAALHAVQSAGLVPGKVGAIEIRVPQAGASYPGCDHTGPFATILQAKMSIQFNVAAAILHGRIAERNFEHLDAPALRHLISVTTLVVDDAMSAAYPGLQGGAVTLRSIDGDIYRAHLDDVIPADEASVHARFRAALAAAMDDATAQAVDAAIEGLADEPDAARLPRLVRRPARDLGVAA